MTAQQLAEDLAGRLKLRRRPRSWGGDCPACGYHAAFWIKANPQYARPMLRCSNGCTPDQLAAAAEAAMGSSWKPPQQAGEEDAAQARERKQQAAERLWSGAGQIEADNPAGLYLRHRRLPHLIGSEALRYRADASHPEAGRLRAMIALVQDAAGALIGVHRTYLAEDGHKAAVDPPKASLGPIWTGAIRLQPAAAELVVGEGIESAAAAGLLVGLPAWAAISAGNMATGLELPPGVRSVTVASDYDGPGERAAAQAAARWRGEGRKVRIIVPDRPGQDFADVLLERSVAGR